MKKLFLIFALAFAIFYPSLFVFYTNDDFFHLAIAKVNSLSGFFNFFNFLSSPQSWSFYRPLTTQVFYFIGEKIFNFQAFGLHIISFLFFFGMIYLIYRLVKKLGGSEKVALISSFLYATSATHFGHLYFLGAFQELGMAFFVILSCLFFVGLISDKKRLYYLPISVVAFIFSIMSKETAVVTPFLLGLIYVFLRSSGTKVINLKKFLIYLLPFAVCLFGYLFIRFYSFGFAGGDSYVWDFSIKRLINTICWYLVWSFNIPEMLVDFVGPGLHFNSNLFLYWSNQIFPIFGLFVIQMGLTIYLFIRSKILNYKPLILFCFMWFLISLVPVAFLPLHKFTFYLTLPLIGVVFGIGYLLEKSKVNNLFIISFLAVWTIMSFFTLKLTVQTNWVSQGETIAKKVYDYINISKSSLDGKTIMFYDSGADVNLPFSPTLTMKNTLSDNNFFEVFYGGRIKAVYGDHQDNINVIKIQSREFLGY